MHSTLKTSELEKFRNILLATLDYLDDKFGESIVYDDFSPIAEYYQQERRQTEKYFKERRLDRLEQKFETLKQSLINRVEIEFSDYLRSTTGYEIDIFEELKNSIELILSQNEIGNQQELMDIFKMIDLLEKTGSQNNQLTKLKNILSTADEISSKKKSNEHTFVLSEVEKDGFIEVNEVSVVGTKPKHFSQESFLSPNGKFELNIVKCETKDYASTEIVVHFPTANGAVYSITGIKNDITAFWEDNETVVINVQKGYEPIVKHHRIRSFNDTISIKYIEN